ncbi:MAG: RidA family protein [Candidatus Kapabacteria bacterium]|nr:RidA family protein [Candidatus Kapabacteria bacterium]
MIQTLNAKHAPAAIGPYSHAVACKGAMIFLSGQIALRADGTLVEGDASAQTEQIFRNIRAILHEAGLELGSVVKTTVFLTDMQDFAAMNSVYAETFGDHRPARSTVQVSRLPKDVAVEIEVVACQP